MRKIGDTLIFTSSDMPFVKRFGIEEATKMVGDFYAEHDLPFLFDTYQLSSELGLRRKTLFSLTRNPEKLYYPVTLSKKNGGTRKLHVPFTVLRGIQRHILNAILNKLPVSSYATAYRRKHQPLHNAAPHCGKRYLLKMDIRDFFGSIRFDQVYRAAFHTRHFPVQIGAMLTSLCCYQERLPQGAPTSPALSNLVMKHFDEQMGEWCQKQGIAYTRYSDDLTFSADVPLYHVYKKAKAFLEHMGFELNDKKTHFITNASQQSVTGLVVNGDTPTVSRKTRRALRQELYYVQKYGLGDAIMRGNRTAFIKDGRPLVYRYLNHLEGRVGYMLHVMGEDDELKNALQMLHRRRQNLLIDAGVVLCDDD